MKTRQVSGIALSLLAIIAFIMLLVYSLAELSKINDSMRIDGPNNMLWVVSRAQSAGLLLQTTALRYMNGKESDSELERRHHVFVSRIHLLWQGPQKRAIAAMGFADQLQTLHQTLPTIDHLVNQLKNHNNAALNQLHRQLKNKAQFLGHVANKAMIVDWNDLGQKLDEVKRKLWYILLAMIGLLVSGIILILHLFVTMRASSQHAAAFRREHQMAEMYRDFGTMVSHQFRTPLAIIDSSMQRLIRRSTQLSAEEIQERGNKTREAVARLLYLIESVLEAARLEAGQIESQAQVRDLSTLVKNCCHEAKQSASGRDITIKQTDLAPTRVICDPIQSEQVIQNLLSNAIKYSPNHSSVTVTVEQAQGVARCIVTNQGSLANAVNKDALFERYYRGTNARGIKGLGIGLFMAKTLAKQQQGDLDVDEKRGHVSFCFRLPLAKEA